MVSDVNTGQVLGTVSGGSSQTFYEPPGTKYSLQATADSGSVFNGWSGALSGTTDPATITVSAPESVQANFVTVQFNFLTAYDAIDPATGYNYWVASVGQVSGYSGPLQLTFYVTSTANGQTYTVSTTVDPNSRGWFYTGVLTISGGYGVWGHGVAAKEVVISIQTTGGQWIPVKTYSGWAWGVIITHAETYVGQLQNQIGGTMTISVPSWDGIVLYTIHDTGKTVLLPQQTTVQLSATPDSGYYFYQFELAQGSAYNQPSNPLWTSTSNPYQWTTPPSGTDAYSYGGYLTAEFRQTSLTFTVYSPMFTNVPFTLYLTGPNGQTSWSATTSWTLSGWLASNTWSGLPQGTYSWYISPTSYNGYPAVPQYGTIVLTSTATQVISYGGKLYTVTFQESGLPSGATWSVQFDGQNLSATAPNSIVFQGVPQGTYSWSAGPNPYYPGTNGVRYYSGAASGSLSVSGNTTKTVSWSEQYEVVTTYTPANAYSTGTQPAPTSNGQATTWVDVGSSFTVTAYPGTYWYVYTITANILGTTTSVHINDQYGNTGGVWYETGTVSSVNEPLAITVPFKAVEMQVQESGLPGGTTWSVNYPSGTTAWSGSSTISGTIKWDENPSDNSVYP
ncbi:MAG: InlB B-repeat-containing protein, partial [Conexivisphaera sp.]